VWQVSIVPSLWFIGIVASQAYYGRCVILEYISRLKRTLPKNGAVEDYLLADFLVYLAKQKGLKNPQLNAIKHENFKETDLHTLKELPRRLHGSYKH
jgi:hypothetical protein